MIFKIPSKLGHHEAAVLEADTAKAVFDKLTGRSEVALNKVTVPDTIQDLEQLFTVGKLGYRPMTPDNDGNLIPMREYNPSVKEIVMLNLITGG